MPRDDDQPVEIADPFAKRLMVRYIGRREEDLASMRSALDDSDFESIRVKGHNLYGSGGAYGLDRISELGGSLETAALAKDHSATGEIIDALENYLRALRVI